jgi:hypothetical protein
VITFSLFVVVAVVVKTNAEKSPRKLGLQIAEIEPGAAYES